MLMAAAAGGAVLLAKALTSKRRAFDFRGRTALITGGSRGLGLVLARQLAGQGARIARAATARMPATSDRRMVRKVSGSA